ncbi:MAG: 5'/3'-nucleotidase SurE [Elainellaceae cyanobacterium]
MKLLISNDDGVFATGIRTLANTLAADGHEITVVCPDRERSATGHGLTLHDPIRAERVDAIFADSVAAWACSGTPSDCVKLALGALLKTPPDLVLSGINHGPNLGTDVLYSGTVSAAMEGVIEGIPGIAFSLASFSAQEFQPAANIARSLIDSLDYQALPKTTLLNVNIPAVEESSTKGLMLTRQGIRRYVDLFEKRVDPRGKTYYWLAGEVLEEIDDVADHTFCGGLADNLLHIETDVQAIRRNYVTVTPLHYNMTSASGIRSLKQQPWLE